MPQGASISLTSDGGVLTIFYTSYWNWTIEFLFFKMQSRILLLRDI